MVFAIIFSTQHSYVSVNAFSLQAGEHSNSSGAAQLRPCFLQAWPDLYKFMHLCCGVCVTATPSFTQALRNTLKTSRLLLYNLHVLRANLHICCTGLCSWVPFVVLNRSVQVGKSRFPKKGAKGGTPNGLIPELNPFLL